MARKVRLTERQLRRLISEAVQKQLDRHDLIVSKFAECITGLDEHSAKFVASELIRCEGADSVMEFIVNHMNGYGYGGSDIYGNYEF